MRKSKQVIVCVNWVFGWLPAVHAWFPVHLTEQHDKKLKDEAWQTASRDCSGTRWKVVFATLIINLFCGLVSVFHCSPFTLAIVCESYRYFTREWVLKADNKTNVKFMALL